MARRFRPGAGRIYDVGRGIHIVDSVADYVGGNVANDVAVKQA